MKIMKIPLLLSAFFLSLLLLYIAVNPERNKLTEETRKQLHGHEYIELSQGVTHYRLEGSPRGKPIVLVHGGTIPIWTWDRQINPLVLAGYRVLSYDTYGRGYSDRPHVTYDRDLYLQQLEELVDALDFNTPFNLVGLSMGGATAANYTSVHPDRVERLVLISPVIHDFKVIGIFKIPVLGEFMARMAGVRVIQKRFASLGSDLEQFEHYAHLYKEQSTYKGFQQSLLSMLRNDAVGDYREEFSRVGKEAIPVLLIWGTEDQEISRTMIDSVQTAIPQVEFKPIEGAGHGIVFQKSEEITRLLLDFL